jgi:hypothetical protein
MERKALNVVFEIRKYEDRRGHSLFTFYLPPTGVHITQLSTEFNKHKAKIIWKMSESQLFGTSIQP